jgi:hypothetical protein
LRDLDPALRLGVVTTGDEFHAHAWLEIDGRPLEYVAAFDVFQHDVKDDYLDLGDDSSVPIGEHEILD